MQAFQSIQSYQPPAKSLSTVDVTHISNISYSFTPHVSTPFTVSNTTKGVESAKLIEYRLISFGKLLAITLANTLNQLRNYNEEAIYPIVSFIEPYKKVDQDLYVRMPPKSSREVTIEVIRRGKAKPKADLD